MSEYQPKTIFDRLQEDREEFEIRLDELVVTVYDASGTTGVSAAAKKRIQERNLVEQPPKS